MIYLDLDGVFADFNGAVQKHCPGLIYQQHSKQIWQVLETIPNFFSTLDLLPNLEIYDMALGNDINVEFLTALPRATGFLKTAQRDKTDWVHSHIDDWAQVNCVSSWEMKKYFCRGEHDLLIDDSPRNIEDWAKAGGTGILHITLEDTLQQMHQLGIT
jgi:5'(3')-deoxyribonucleotidase